MPTVFTHAAVGFLTARIANEISAINTPVLLSSMAVAALPDADGLFFGTIPYDHPFGHRGFTHSLFFATILGVSLAAIFSRARWAPQSVWFLAALFAASTASHGFFDAMTDGGRGVAFLAPFSNHRYFFPWRPIPVAPLSFEGLLNRRGMRVIRTEAELIWPFALGAAIWNRKFLWRMALAATFAITGTMMWIIALSG